MPWSLEQAYDAYPQIEEEFSDALDQSLDPRGPDLLYDLVARLGLAPGAVALDVGCGEGRQALALAHRFGFRARLQRNRASYLERYGQAAYDMMPGDCLWHVYAMIGKLERRVYLLSSDGADR